jgi:hypothetical protein
MNTQKNLFQEGIYNPDHSLLDDIEVLSNPKISITIQNIINLVVKYFFAYIINESVDIKIKEAEVTDVFSRFSFYCENAHYAKKFSFSKESIRFRTSSYQLCMLWDISSTVEIIEDIISRRIDDILGNKQYHWIDLWTWSGILLLGQYIQARRNWLTPQSDKNIGIELDKNVQTLSHTLANKIWFWKVIQWDIRQIETFKWLEMTPHFVGNENLPNETNTFGMADDIKEPFFEAIFALESSVSLEVSKLFPRRVFIWWNILTQEEEIFLESSVNRTHIRNFYNSFLWKVPRINPSSRLYPLSIEINWRIKKLSEVWKHLEKQGIIRQAVTNERRWF